MEGKPRLLRITTVPISLKLLLQGQFTFFQDQGFDVLTVSANGAEISYLKENKIAHTIIGFTRTISPVRDAYCLIQLILLMRKFKPHIVHTHTPKAGLLGMMAAWICRVPIRLHTVAGLPLMEATGRKRKLLEMTERLTYACAHKVYPNSKGLYDFISQEFKGSMVGKKCKIIGKGSSNGIDTDYFSRTRVLEAKARQLRQQYVISETDIVFIFVGRIVKDKGIVELINAFRIISADVPSRLLLVGSFEDALDPLPNETLQFIRTSDKVVTAGFQEDVRPWLMASDALVFPSYREGFPNVVMQAQSLSIPCIVSNINGCNELVEDGKTGWVVAPKNAEQLKNAMRELMLNREKAKVMADKAQEFVVANYTRTFVWDELLAEYRYLLSQTK